MDLEPARGALRQQERIVVDLENREPTASSRNP